MNNGLTKVAGFTSSSRRDWLLCYTGIFHLLCLLHGHISPVVFVTLAYFTCCVCYTGIFYLLCLLHRHI